MRLDLPTGRLASGYFRPNILKVKSQERVQQVLNVVLVGNVQCRPAVVALP